MKKNLPSLLIAIFFIVSAKAQYVNIPDPEFKRFLQNKYPSCLDNNGMLDTTCADILALTSITDAATGGVSFSNYSILNLDGIQYFKSLKNLYCPRGLTSLPTLPENLEWLDCSNSLLTILPKLPQSLKVLNCSNNNLNSLPSLGDSLQHLECYNNNIYCLPALPGSINAIVLDSSKIHCIPDTTSGRVFNYNGYPSNDIHLPVCNTANNVNNCPLIPFAISGSVFYDNNNNEIIDSAEPYKANCKVFLSGNSKIYSTTTNQNGFYIFMPETAGSYTLTEDTISQLYTGVPAIDTFNLTTDTSITQNIALQSTLKNKDSLAITGQGLFITETSYPDPQSFPLVGIDTYSGSMGIQYYNNGSVSVNPAITVYYDSTKIKYRNSSNTSVINTGKSLLLMDTNLLPGESRSFTLFFADTTTINNPDSFSFVTNATITTVNGGTLTAFMTEALGLLPLNLTAFNAVSKADNTALLFWSTVNEINAKSFVVEQSNDGLHFTDIASIKARGTGNNQYSFTTDKLNAIITYFRLRMIDNDGKYTYSTIVKTTNNTTNTAIEVSPNPATNKVTIRNINTALFNTSAKIVNSLGVIVKNVLLKQSTQTIDISNLPSGLYFIQTENGIQKIIIAH